MKSLKRADYIATLGKTSANYVRVFKVAGGITFGAFTLFSTGLTYNYYKNGGTCSDMFVKFSFGVTMGVVGLFWPIGTGISATYFIFDAATGGFGGYGDPEFGLINMNGRMYDPLLGRMLSPDNVVQSPEYSQSYNRYSYAWNNPLKYTDPTGQMNKDPLREFINRFVVFPVKSSFLPLTALTDFLNGDNYLDSYFSKNYLIGEGSPYPASGGMSVGSTANSSWSGGNSGPMEFIDASGQSYSYDELAFEAVLHRISRKVEQK